METIFALAARLQSMNAAEGLALLVVKATLILLIGRLLLVAMPRVSAAAKHAIATATLVAVAALPLLSWVVPAWQIAMPVAEAAAAPVATQAAIENERTIGVADDVVAPAGIAKTVVKAIAPKPVTKVAQAATVVTTTWKGFIVLGIAVAALVMLGHMLAGMIGVWFVAKNARELDNDEALMALDDARGQLGLAADVRLLQSPRVTVPVVWGVFRPVLLLPVDASTWSSDRMRVVLLHELAHLKRVDGVSLILTRIAVSLFWFHPLAWSLERAGRNECERACDDLVLAKGTLPSEYADHLLGIARTMPAFDPFRSVTLAMSRKSQLEGRLLSILQPDVARRVFNARNIAFACAIAVLVIVPVSALRLTAQQAPETKAEQKAEKKAAPLKKSGTTVEVRPEVETLEDYLSDAFSTFRGDDHLANEWNDRAFDLYRADRYVEAAEAFRRASEESKQPNPTALYNMACAYGLAGDAKRAGQALREALGAGWDDFDKIADDEDFDRVRNAPAFASVLSRYGTDAATRRLNLTLERYDELRSNRNATSHQWHEVGTALLGLRRFEESLDALDRALDSSEHHSSTLYNIACAHALRGNREHAIEFLDRAIENGYSSSDHMKEDADLASLRSDARWTSLLRKAEDLEMRHRMPGRTWPDVADIHKRMTDKYPQSGRAWFNYGYALLQSREYEQGIAIFKKTMAMNYQPGKAAFNIACAYARMDAHDQAFDWLAEAKSKGFDVAKHAEDDEDLDPLRRDARWQRFAEKSR